VKEVNPVTELQPLKFTDSVNNIEFRVQGDTAPQEIIRLDSKGFHYRGQLIEDAGEAHRLMVEFLKQSTQSQPEPVAPTDEELSSRFRAWWHNEGSGLPPLPGMDHEEHVRRISEIAWANGAYVARYGTPANNIREEN
jgi:hypothetical protein